MATDSSSNTVKVDRVPSILSSDWTGLSPFLIAKFYPVRRLLSGTGWEQSLDQRTISQADNFTVDDGYEVHCPLTDGTMDINLNWQSPFEGAGTESKAPTLAALLQSGSLTPTLQAASKLGIDLQGGAVGGIVNESVGRTGITKLNSTQTFSGMPPISFPVTAHFRALMDPMREVVAPVKQLEEWAVPQYLASEGLIANGINKAGQQDAVQTVFPSQTPQIIGMRYADMTLLPLVIESMSKPITVARDAYGSPIAIAIQMKLCTLAAWDRRDIKGMYSR